MNTRTFLKSVVVIAAAPLAFFKAKAQPKASTLELRRVTIWREKRPRTGVFTVYRDQPFASLQVGDAMRDETANNTWKTIYWVESKLPVPQMDRARYGNCYCVIVPVVPEIADKLRQFHHFGYVPQCDHSITSHRVLDMMEQDWAQKV